MPFNLGGPELIIILVVVLIVFGAGRLPNVMADLGKGVREFKKAQEEDTPAAPAAAPQPPATVQSQAQPPAPAAPQAPTVTDRA